VIAVSSIHDTVPQVQAENHHNRQEIKTLALYNFHNQTLCDKIKAYIQNNETASQLLAPGNPFTGYTEPEPYNYMYSKLKSLLESNPEIEIFNYTNCENGCYPVTNCKPQVQFRLNANQTVLACLQQFVYEYQQQVYSANGFFYELHGDHTEAVKNYKKALALNPKVRASYRAWPLFGVGMALDGLGKYTGAIPYYDKALAIQPNNTWALTNKGLDLDNLGNHTGAILYYDKALALIDNHGYQGIDQSLVDSIGIALDNQGNHAGAIKLFDKVLQINPSDPIALNNKGVSLYKLGRYPLSYLFILTRI
jgi:tetratricopeptide (TPR) repeat protein